MPDADHDAWVEPERIADVMLSLCADATDVTSGGEIPVYGDTL